MIDTVNEETITRIARVAHEANGSYCASIGDFSQTSWDEAPEWQRESAKAGVVAIITGVTKVPEGSHAVWSAHKLADGWKYGPVKDAAKKEHPCLVPYTDLPPEQQAKDRLFFNVVTALLKASNPTNSGQAIDQREHIAQFFAFAHLPEQLQAVSRPFGLMAEKIVADLPRNPERTVALRKLLESKDAAVRAFLAK